VAGANVACAILLPDRRGDNISIECEYIAYIREVGSELQQSENRLSFLSVEAINIINEYYDTLLGVLQHSADPIPLLLERNHTELLANLLHSVSSRDLCAMHLNAEFPCQVPIFPENLTESLFGGFRRTYRGRRPMSQKSLITGMSRRKLATD